jgi:hypothetical protein
MDFPTDNDIKELEKKLKEINRYDVLIVVQIIKKYGFRIGIFQGMEIDDNGNWKSVSKGVRYKGKFTKKEGKSIKDLGILTKKPYIFQNKINKITHRLFNKNIVSCPFSVHDIRRYCINKRLQDDNISFKEGIKISRNYHRNINTTVDHYYKW